MKKSDLLQEPVEQVLFELGFIDRYRELSERFPYKDDSFEYEIPEIIKMMNDLGVSVKRYGEDQFFSDVEPHGGFQFRFGLTIKYNIVDFDATIINEKLAIRSGGSWGLIVQLMTDWKVKVIKPGFGNYEQLKSLLQDAVALYLDIKRAVVKR